MNYQGVIRECKLFSINWTQENLNINIITIAMLINIFWKKAIIFKLKFFCIKKLFFKIFFIPKKFFFNYLILLSDYKLKD